MAGKPKDPKPGDWKFTVGDVPHQVTAYERADRENRIHTRVYVGNGKYVGKGRALSWKGADGKEHDSIRDAAGKIIPARALEAQQAALSRSEELAAAERRTPLAEDGPTSIPFDGTLGEGFRRMLHPVDGKFPADTLHKADAKRAAATVLKILGPGTLWEGIRFADYRKVWREMARVHKASLTASPGSRGRWGYRRAQVVCSQLAACARWLAQEGLIPPGTAEPARRWKGVMKGEWEDIVGPVAPLHRPRYAAEEVDKLFAASHLADPRAELALQLGAEGRLGQVIERTRRSDIQPSPDGRVPLWRVNIHGRGKKLAKPVVLTDDQREAVTAALHGGYLTDLEDAYQGGTLKDYFLFPAGRLVSTRPVRVIRPPAAGTARLDAERDVLATLNEDSFTKVAAPALSARWGWKEWLVRHLIAEMADDGRVIVSYVRGPHGGYALRLPRPGETQPVERGSRARIANASKPLGKTGMSKMWHKLEELAGVRHLKGGNWYRLRRRQTDAIDELERARPEMVDEQVKLTSGGWKDPRTRSIYQQEGNLEDEVRTAEARALIRPPRGAKRA